MEQNYTYDAISKFKSRNEIVNLLRMLADELNVVDEGNFFNVWMKILHIIEKNNPEIMKMKNTIGKTMSQVVVDEIERLYALDKTIKSALKSKE